MGYFEFGESNNVSNYLLDASNCASNAGLESLSESQLIDIAKMIQQERYLTALKDAFVITPGYPSVLEKIAMNLAQGQKT